ncbi:NACHT domain-containing protein [Streptomyces chattanoogensis]|uniref:NACHT domain-containing protein n=1 Tax=Streptomyces chattanoogensis TaxID=66876 RepID=UPI0006B497B3|nr:NACHT domain-containing protein [Streptomyces chattanoogensis]
MAHQLHPPKATFRPPRVRIVTGPPEGGVIREGWAHLRLWFVAPLWRWRTRWLLRRGAIHAHRWWNPWRTTLAAWIVSLLALALVAWVLDGVVGTLREKHHRSAELVRIPVTPAVQDVAMPVLLLAASTALFLYWRLRRIRRFCASRARSDPCRFVPTAGSLMGEVVGRDQLCNSIMNNLRERKVRRPHVVSGKVGTGKTAVLVRLAERLAAEAAVPIAVRLRDAQDRLDFAELARKRFEDIVRPVVRSDGEVDRVWRWLRQHTDRIVVLADGLEEALNHDDRVNGQRDILIREAIARADEEGLPLVIASRPHDPLRAMQAAITELEPLSDEAALQYIAGSGGRRSDPMLLDRVVEAAKMSESPLYLQIARDLHGKNLLEPLWTQDEGGADLMLHDSWALRADLLERWVDALVDGEIHPELPIGRDTRQVVVEYLSALACIGLASDRADVGLWELDPSVGTGRPVDGDAWNQCVAEKLDRALSTLRWSRDPKEFDDRMEAVRAQQCWGPEYGREDRKVPVHGARIDVRLAATWGRRMGLVHEEGEKVHFQHSIMQAYLGSRLLPAAGDTPSRPKASERLLATALEAGGRELLIALTLRSRSWKGHCAGHRRSCGCGASRPEACADFTLPKLLEQRALDLLKKAKRGEHMQGRWQAGSSPAGGLDDRGSPRLRALELFGTAVEIDNVAAAPQQQRLIEMIKERWEDLEQGEDPVRLREAKLTLVKQCGAAARRVAADRSCNPAYLELFKVGCKELDYRVRAGIVQEIGAGGEQAYLAVYHSLREPELDAVIATDRPERGCHWKPKSDPTQGERMDRARRRVWVRYLEREEWQWAEHEAMAEKRRWYSDTLQAWILPMLVDSARMTRHIGTPRADLENWVRIATGESGSPAAEATPGINIGLGVALAQGFRYAANRRPVPQSDRQAREFLVKQAQEMLKRSTFWYTRLTLLHALTLWSLPDDVTEDMPIRGHGSDPQGQVQEWLAMGDGKEKEHPLVKAAGELAVRALQTRRPERYLWIDDAATADGVGTQVGLPGDQRAHNLWIPPSSGWSTLDPIAQQLLSDVLLLVVLGERAYRPKDLFRVVDFCSQERTQIPSCVIRDRNRLDPVRGAERASQPGSNCTDECRLRMCPYPAKVEDLRMEFSEVFCLQQHDLLRWWRPRSWLGLQFWRKAPWQRKVPVAGMRRFWDEMGQRARDVDPDAVDTARQRVRS